MDYLLKHVAGNIIRSFKLKITYFWFDVEHNPVESKLDSPYWHKKFVFSEG